VTSAGGTGGLFEAPDVLGPALIPDADGTGVTVDLRGSAAMPSSPWHLVWPMVVSGALHGAIVLGATVFAVGGPRTLPAVMVLELRSESDERPIAPAAPAPAARVVARSEPRTTPPAPAPPAPREVAPPPPVPPVAPTPPAVSAVPLPPPPPEPPAPAASPPSMPTPAPPIVVAPAPAPTPTPAASADERPAAGPSTARSATEGPRIGAPGTRADASTTRADAPATSAGRADRPAGRADVPVGDLAVAAGTPRSTEGSSSPPRPGHQVAPRYPESARLAGVQGTTLLRVRVKADGSVGEIRVERSAGHADLDAAAIAAVGQWRFEPARRRGAAVDEWVVLPVKFILG
jgi:protein TonB